MKTPKRDGTVRSAMVDNIPLSYTCQTGFTVGEVYLFHSTDSCCPADGSLWGIFDKKIGTEIYLESSSFDLFGFRYWHRLPRKYRYCRLSTRAELRDYAVAEICERLIPCNDRSDRHGL